MTSASTEQDWPSSSPARSRSRHASGQGDRLIFDVYQGMNAWAMWSSVGWSDIRQRYRRSILGPLWITISMGVLVASLGAIYSQVFRMELKTYLPFVCLGFIIWGFFSLTVTESCSAFLESEALIKQIRLPFSVYILRVLWRNFIVFLHTTIIFIPVALIFGGKLSPIIFLVLPGFLLLSLNLFWLGIVLAILSTRYRDVPLIVSSFLQLAFLGTPIIWPASTLGGRSLIVEMNPFYHLIEIVRAPLLGDAPTWTSWLVSLGFVFLISFAAITLFRRAANRLVYWL